MAKRNSNRKNHLLKAKGAINDALWRVEQLLTALEHEENLEIPNHNHPPPDLMNGVGSRFECPRCIWNSEAYDREKSLL